MHKKKYTRFVKKLKTLKSNLYLGHKFYEGDDELTREMVYKNYRIIYQIESNTKIQILTIHHHARLLSNNPALGDNEE